MKKYKGHAKKNSQTWQFSSSCHLKTETDDDVVTTGGKLFHAVAPKARSPMLTRRVGGTSSADVDMECSRRRESTFATQRSSSVTLLLMRMYT